jgi:hypothetical protein
MCMHVARSPRQCMNSTFRECINNHRFVMTVLGTTAQVAGWMSKMCSPDVQAI